MDKSSEVFVGRREKGLLIEVYRIPGRSDLQKCRARAKVVAAREGFHTEPEVAYFDDRVSGDPDRAIRRMDLHVRRGSSSAVDVEGFASVGVRGTPDAARAVAAIAWTRPEGNLSQLATPAAPCRSRVQ